MASGTGREASGVRLADAVEWRVVEVGSGAAYGTVPLHVGTVGSQGPTALVTAGVHGDEGPWGAWAIRRFLDRVPLAALRGRLRLVPVANPLAMEHDARCAPLDNLDLNRTFPGHGNGSHTEMLADALARHAVEGADVVVDLHGGGSWCVNAFVHMFRGGEDLARAMGAPFVTDGDSRGAGTSSLTGYARSRGARVVAVEMGGRGRTEVDWAERIADGLVRALGAAGVLDLAAGREDGGWLPSEAESAVELKPPVVMRPRRGGVFKPAVFEEDIGTLVPRGRLLGELRDPVTFEVVEEFRSPFEKTALLLLRPTLCRIEAGAMALVVSEPIA